MEGTLRCTLGSQAHSLEYYTRSMQLGTSSPPPTLNTSIRFNKKITNTPKYIANCFTKQLTNTVKHAKHKINRATHGIQGYTITPTTTQVQDAIKQSKNTTHKGHDKLNIWYLKHIGPLGLAFLTSMHLIQALITPLSNCQKNWRRVLLLYITANIPNTPTQHGYKTQHYTVMALHTLNNPVEEGFNQMAPLARTITVST